MSAPSHGFGWTYAHQVDTHITRHFRHGGVLVAAIPSVGPARGGRITTMALNDQIVETIGDLSAMPRPARRRTLANTQSAIKTALLRANTLSPDNDGDLMLDLAILMSARLLYGDTVVAPAGLANLMLEIDPDDRLPWHQRGMINPTVVPGLAMPTGPRPPLQ